MSGFLRFVFWLAVIGGAICGIAYYGFFDVWTVPHDDPRLGASIQPTLLPGDIVLVKRHGAPAMGNLVRCSDPDEPRRHVAARVAATGSPLHIAAQTFSTPGSRPSGSGSCPAIRLTNPNTGDDVELSCREEEFAGTAYQTLRYADNTAEHESDATVPLDKVYLISDDRYLHLDSRDYGMLPVSTCQHIVFRLWGAAGFTDSSRRFNLIW
jgi:signal peptidase I